MMIVGYVWARIVAFTIAGHLNKKIDSHELKNEERSRKTILSMKFHGLKESLLGFKREPNESRVVVTF